jgi:hypothetical protein
MQHTIPPNEIQPELETFGHKVRNVLNIRHRVTKEPLPLYVIDLKPQDNKSIYNLQLLCNMKIAVEAPRKKNHIVQCTRCQSYGHTKTYCSRPYVCVKSGGEHNTTLCTKDPTAPATCALCGGDHPASYEGYVIYKNLQHARGKTHHPINPTATQTSTTPVNINYLHQCPTLPHTLHPVPALSPPTPSYSHTVTHHQQLTNTTDQFSIFLNEFKTIFSQLIQQNSMILNMLSTVIHKLTN